MVCIKQQMCGEMEKRGAKAVFGFDINRHIADVDTSKIHGVDIWLVICQKLLNSFLTSYTLHAAGG